MNKHQNSISLKKGLENDQFSYLGPPNEKINFKVVFDVHSYCFWTSPLASSMKYSKEDYYRTIRKITFDSSHIIIK